MLETVEMRKIGGHGLIVAKMAGAGERWNFKGRIKLIINYRLGSRYEVLEASNSDTKV